MRLVNRTRGQVYSRDVPIATMRDLVKKIKRVLK